MARTKVQLKELRDADVTYISLVDRAASRIPFRVIKRQEGKDMLDLNKPGLFSRVFKAEEKLPEVTIASIGIMDVSEVQLEEIKAALTSAGLSGDRVIKQDDGSIMFAQDETPTEGHIVRVSDNMAVVLKGFDPHADKLVDAVFDEELETEGFFQGVPAAIDLLKSRVIKSDVLEKFNTYAMALTEALPEAVFKADEAIREIVCKTAIPVNGNNCLIDLSKIPTAAPASLSQNSWDNLTTGDKVNWLIDKWFAGSAGANKNTVPAFKMDKKAIPAKIKPKNLSQDEWDGMDDEGKEKACKSEILRENLDISELLESMRDCMTDLTAQVTSLTTKADSTSGVVTAMGVRVDEIARKSDTALKALKSTVIAGGVQADDPYGKTQKSESQIDDDPRTGFFDTAFIKRQKRELKTAR